MTGRVRRDCRCRYARHRHGTWLAYACDDCRCLPCTAANTVYSRELRKRRYLAGGALQVDGAGTARRLQALAVIGYGSRELSEMYGHGSRSSLEQWRRGVPLVTLATAKRVGEMYDHLWNQPRSGGYPARTIRWALAEGYQPPLAWDDDTIDDPTSEAFTHNPLRVIETRMADSLDEIAVERAMRGDRVPLTSPETSAAITRLAAMRMTDAEIGERLRMSAAAVCKRRERCGIESRVVVAGRWRAVA